MNEKLYFSNFLCEIYQILPSEKHSKKISQILDSDNFSSFWQRLFKTNSKFVKKFIKKKYQEIIEDIKNLKSVHLSEIHFVIIGLKILKISIKVNEKKIIQKYIIDQMNLQGGFYSAKPKLEWHSKTGSTIYGTYYGLASLQILESQKDLIQNYSEWLKNTLTWLLNRQSNTGQFFDEAAPFSEKIENNFWAIWILKNLRTFNLYEKSEKIITNLTDAINLSINCIESFLQSTNDGWSTTRLFYALNSLRITGNFKNLTQSQIKTILDFLQSLENNNLYREFPLSVKKGYRVDKNEAPKEALLHSSIFGNIIINLCNQTPISNSVIGLLLKKFKQKNGFGSQIKIKNMDYGVDSTIFENVLLLIFCLKV